jgi:hypothetical protein
MINQSVDDFLKKWYNFQVPLIPVKTSPIIRMYVGISSRTVLVLVEGMKGNDLIKKYTNNAIPPIINILSVKLGLLTIIRSIS